MNNVFLFLFILAVSAPVNAKNSISFPQSIFFETKNSIQNLPKAFKVRKTEVLVKNEANNLELWNLLDTNKDEFISKTEAEFSREIIERWDELDSNEDGKLDFIDFSRLSNRKS